MSSKADQQLDSVLARILAAQTVFYQKFGTNKQPMWVVMDPETYREMNHVFAMGVTIAEFLGQKNPQNLARILGTEIVVLPSDGIPMIKFVGSPADEARRG